MQKNQKLANEAIHGQRGGQLTVSPRTPGPGPAGDGRLISKNRPQEHFASHHRALAGTDTQIGAK